MRLKDLSYETLGFFAALRMTRPKGIKGMDLQAAFYVIAIITMFLLIVFLLFSFWTLFSIRRELVKLQAEVISRIISYTRPVDVFRGVTTSVISNFLLRLRDNLGLH